MKRRTLVVGAAAAGVAGGISVALWRSKSSSDAEGSGPVDLWSLSFSGVDGAPMPMKDLRGQALLLNFWATWCGPCATEMPLLDAFAKTAARRGCNVLALAIDSADPVRLFLARRALSLRVALAGAEGLSLSRGLGNSAGALPFTVVFAANGELVQRRLGTVDEAWLERWTSPL